MFFYHRLLKYDGEIENNLTIRNVYQQLIAIIIINLLHLFVFFYFNSKIMIIYNSISLLIFFLVFNLIRTRKLELYNGIINLQLLIYTWMCSIFIGLAFGISYILILNLAYSFVSFIQNKVAINSLITLQIISFIGQIFLEKMSYIKDVRLIDFTKEIQIVGYFNTSLFLLMTFIVIKKYRDHYQKAFEDYKNKVEIDSLTSLYNRNTFIKRANNELETFKKFNHSFVIAFCDIDNFKSINDNYGHDMGDLALKKLADIILANLRSSDYCCRWGGEEFIIMLTNTDINGARQVIENLRNKIVETEIKNDNNSLKFTVTFGLSKSCDLSIEDIIQIADKRMYMGKEAGKNIVIG